MIRWVFVLCLGASGFLATTGQRVGRNQQYPSNTFRNDANASLGNSSSAGSGSVNKTPPRKIGGIPKCPGMRKAWREIRDEIAALRKSIEPLTTSSNSSTMFKQSSKVMTRQYVSLVGDLRFIKAELQYIKHQTHVLWENISDARRDHKRMSKPLWWIANNMTDVQQSMEKTQMYLGEFQRTHSTTATRLEVVADRLNDVTALTTSLQQTSADVGDLKQGYIQGTSKISGEIDGVKEMVRLLGHGVHETRELVVSGVGRLDQSMGAGHAYLASNLSDMSSQLMAQNSNLAGLGHKMQEMRQAVYEISEKKVGMWNMLLKVSQTMSDVSATTLKIDGALGSGLMDLQLKINDVNNLVRVLGSSVSYVQSDVVQVKAKLRNITRLIKRKFSSGATGSSVEEQDYQDDTFPPPQPATTGLSTEYSGLPTLPPLPGLPTSPSPVTPYPTIPIFSPFPPVYQPGNVFPGIHEPGIGTTVPRPMWPLPPPAPNGAPVGSIDLIQELPWGPYGPGIPIGFSNRFSGHCTCKCPCPCVCPILNQETTGHLNPYNTTPWTADLSGGSNNSIRKDCYCLCTCPCPGSFVAPIAPPVSAGSNVPGVNPIPHFPTYPQVPPKPHDTLLFDLLNELLRGHMLIREDISQMRLSFKADLDEMRHLILEQTGQSFEYILQVMQTNNDSHIKFVTEKWKILESMYSELRIEAERVAVTLEVLYVNFIQFHTEFREILANNNLSSDRLSGYPPIATRPPSYSSGHQLPDFGSPGPSHHGYSPKTGGKKADSLGLQPPPGSRPENSPDGETNRTDAADLEPKSRMLPVRLDDHQRVPNPAGSRAVEGGRKDLSSEGCIIIADCFGIAGPWSPLFIAMRAPYSDGEVALQGNEEPLGVLKNRWGIWNTMASPGRRMHSNGLFTLHDFFQQHIDDQLMSIFQTSKRRPGRNRRKRRRRPRPYRYPQRPLIPGLHYIRPPVMQSSIISAVGSPDGMLIHKLPWIPSESLEHLPPRITMPRIDNLPYSMSYIDERGNSVNININRRNNPVAGKPRAARSSEGENPNLRRCLMGEK